MISKEMSKKIKNYFILHPKLSHFLARITWWRPITRHEYEKLVKIVARYVDENNAQVLAIKLKINEMIKQLRKTGQIEKLKKDDEDDVMFL